MRKSEYIGWKEVFHFTLAQGMKGGAYKGFLIVGCLIVLLAQPVVNFFKTMDKEEEAYHCEVTEFTVYDEVGLPIDYTKALADEGFKDVKINTAPTMSFDDHMKLLEEKSKDKEGEKSKEVIVHMTYEEAGYFNLTFVKASNADLKDNDAQKLADTFYSYFDEERINAIQVSQEQMDFLNRPVDTKLEFVTEAGEAVPEEEKAEAISTEEYNVMYILIFVVFMIVNLCGSSIATSIITEKSTKVVEYLMINIRPMALITGKILANLVMVIIQFAAMGVCFVASGFINKALFGEAEKVAATEGFEVSVMDSSAMLELLSGVSVGEVLMAVVAVICGMMFFCILAGLCGATASKLEELSESTKLYTMLQVIGFLLSFAVVMMLYSGAGNQTFTNICCLLPISSPFILPACLLLGKVSWGVSIIGLVLLVVVVWVLFTLSAMVYESLIFYNGKVMSFKDILQIAKNRRQVERKGEMSHE
ncbi:MAG: ABC transporter permease [Lachnospiraceae bacterium]|nr:ABC transporter permease [Lachnospiraceae bacterium]